MKLVVTDLDGTLLNDEHKISNDDFETLISLEKKGVVRVIATGRSLYSLNKVLSEDFPVDYILFSTGAGIMDWKTKQIIYKQELSAIKTAEIIDLLKLNKVDFMVHKPIPDNHLFYYHCYDETNVGFKNRLAIYSNVAEEIENINSDFSATQFVVILPSDVGLFDSIRNKLSGVKVIRATSPINDNHIWLEIFPETVSKGHTLEWLCGKLNVDLKETVGIGNDYNDVDMLDITGESYVVENTPDELKKKYIVVNSNNENGFSQVVNSIW